MRRRVKMNDDGIHRVEIPEVPVEAIISEHTERQFDRCISYIVNTLRNPIAAEAVLDDIEHA